MGDSKFINALRVNQPFGEFFIISISAKDLLDVTFSDVLRYDDEKKLRGSQRLLEEKKRIVEIRDYINSQDLAFPNSIIISANFNEAGFIEDDDNIKWKIHKSNDDVYKIEIPSKKKLAAIIDGQHRLKGFEYASDVRKNTELLVSVYFDLPTPYQAYLFATINYNQKPVNKSLALEQFGYLTDLTPAVGWSPELLSVYLTRNINQDRDSSFFNHIKVAPQNDDFLFEISQKEQDWLVSTATVVDGFLKLITKNPKFDSNQLSQYVLNDRHRSKLTHKDTSPLRNFYLENNDLFIYKTVVNFFNAAEEELFLKIKYKSNSFITKTVGIQALFYVLKVILKDKLKTDKNISVEYFKQFLTNSNNIDFNDNFFTASGIGKSRIQNIILIAAGLKNINDINQQDIDTYKYLLSEI